MKFFWRLVIDFNCPSSEEKFAERYSFEIVKSVAPMRDLVLLEVSSSKQRRNGAGEEMMGGKSGVMR